LKIERSVIQRDTSAEIESEMYPNINC